MESTATLQRLDRIAWTIIGLVAAAVFATAALTTFKIDWASFLLPVSTSAALIAGIWFYRRRREDLKLASALSGTVQILAFAAVAAPLSYIAASINLPLLDHVFDTADAALGLQWRALLDWMNANPVLYWHLRLAYMSFPVQATATVLALAFTGNHSQIRKFILAFMITTIVTIAVSALLPAQGTWGHFGLTQADHPAITPVFPGIHLPVFHGLRDGSFRMLQATGSEGIISFPSLHAALGVIFIFALWPVPVLRWIGLTVNLMMIAATPVDGGHYFVDVIAGLINALLIWAAVSWFARRIAECERPLQIARLVPGE